MWRRRVLGAGEDGPEIFVPSSSGRIVANGSTSTGTALAGITLIQNFNATTIGTSRDFEDTVRRAIYDVQRRNPGSGL